MIPKWHFVKLNKELVRKELDIQEQKKCEHKFWIAKCSCCGKILASETQNVTEIDIIKIVK